MKTKLHTNTLPEWLRAIEFIRGAEGEDDSSTDDSTNDDSNDDGAQGDTSSDSQDDTHDDSDDPKVNGLKSALQKERDSNKTNARKVRDLEKQLRAAQKVQEERELAEKTEAEQATARAEKAAQQVARLAEGLKNRELNAAIEKAARDAKFIDVDDALSGVDRSKISVEQDEDDPSDITIDLKSVVAEVKGLAARKKHLIQAGTEDGGATGSTFAGGGQKKGKTPDDELKSRYPALR